MHRHKLYQTKLKSDSLRIEGRIEGGEAFLVNCAQSAQIRSYLGHKLINNTNF